MLKESQATIEQSLGLRRFGYVRRLFRWSGDDVPMSPLRIRNQPYCYIEQLISETARLSYPPRLVAARRLKYLHGQCDAKL